MNVIHVEKESILNGTGNRCVLWLAGCPHHCIGCHNPETWDPNVGHEFGSADWNDICESLDNPYIRGITFSGGDPLAKYNVDELTRLAEEIKTKYPNKTIWCYTGYKWEDVKELPIIQYFDVLVDGTFNKELFSPNKPWVGSSNQRVIDVKKSLSQGKVVEV